MEPFEPDYRNILATAWNREAPRIALYEHIIDDAVIEQILDTRLSDLTDGDEGDKRRYIRLYVRFFEAMGYDTVSFERLIAPLPGRIAVINLSIR